MKTSRISAAVVATLALFAAADASAQQATGGSTVVLNTYSKAIVVGATKITLSSRSSSFMYPFCCATG